MEDTNTKSAGRTAKIISISGAIVAVVSGIMTTILAGFQLAEMRAEKEEAAEKLEQARQLLQLAEEQARSVEELANITRGQVREVAGIREATADLFDEARIQSRNSSASARTAQEAVVLQQKVFNENTRARISFGERTIFNDEEKLRFAIRMNDTGGVPARNVSLWSLIGTYKKSDNLPDTPPCSSPRYTGSYTVGTHKYFRISDSALSEEQQEQIENGNLLVVVLGAACYDDGFGNRRRTRLCIVYENGSNRDCLTGNDVE